MCTLSARNRNSDIPQVLVLNFVYETPAPGGWNRAARLALGGWQISGIFRAQSGVPFTVYSGRTSSWQLAGSDWAQYAPGVTHAHTHPGIGGLKPLNGGLTGYLDLSDFDPNGPPQASSGDTGKNPGLFGPGQNNWDLGVSKNLHFTERYRLQMRWEMFNAFNRTSLGQPYPYTSAGANFGLIYYTQNPSRVMQGALKVTF